MSQPDPIEMRELRERLNGALQDLTIRDGTIAALRATLVERDRELEERAAEVTTLHAEKRTLHDWLCDESALPPSAREQALESENKALRARLAAEEF